MAHNRDNLRRTWEDHFEAGVFVKEDPRGGYVASVLLPAKAGAAGEVVTLSAFVMPRVASREVAVARARSWAALHVPAIFEFDPADLDIALLDRPTFD